MDRGGHLHDIKLNKTMGTQFGFKLKGIKNTSSVALPDSTHRSNAIEAAGNNLDRQLDIYRWERSDIFIINIDLVNWTSLPPLLNSVELHSLIAT